MEVSTKGIRGFASTAGRRRAYGIVGSAQQGAVAGDGDTGHRHLLLGDQLVGAVVFGEIPYADTSSAVAADNLALVGVDNHIVHGGSMRVAPLNVAGPRLPYLHSSVLRTRHHPFSLAVKRDAGDVALVALEHKQGNGVGGSDIEELDGAVAGSS